MATDQQSSANDIYRVYYSVNIYRLQRSCGKVMFSQVSVILFTGGGMRGRGVCMAGEMVTAADGTHPTGMHSCYYAVIDLFQNSYPTDKFK